MSELKVRPHGSEPAHITVKPDGSVSYAGWVISGSGVGEDAIAVAIAEWIKRHVIARSGGEQ